MIKKKYLLLIICLLTLFTLTGCSKKKVITTNEFKTIAQNYGYSIETPSQNNDYDNINETIIASKPSGIQVKYYVLNSTNDAKNMFTDNKKYFKTFRGNTTIESSINIFNYSSYSITSNNNYMYICRIENTLLYVKVEETFKSEVKDFIKALNY